MKENIIILATYNGEKYLDDFLFSLEKQTCQNFNIFVSDDNSSDSTIEILQNSVFYKTNRLSIINNSNVHGACGNFCNAIVHAPEAKKYFFADQDDYWHEDKISLMNEEMEKYNKEDTPIMIVSDLHLVDANLNSLNTTYFKNANVRFPEKQMALHYTLIQNLAPGCAMSINNKTLCLLRSSILNNANLPVIMHDYLAIEIAAFLGEVHYINKPLIDYRQHNNNTIGAPAFSLSALMQRFKLGINKYGFNSIARIKANFFTKRSQANRLLLLEGAQYSKYYDMVKKFVYLSNQNRLSKIKFLLSNEIYFSKAILNILEFIFI